MQLRVSLQAAAPPRLTTPLALPLQLPSPQAKVCRGEDGSTIEHSNDRDQSRGDGPGDAGTGAVSECSASAVHGASAIQGQQRCVIEAGSARVAGCVSSAYRGQRQPLISARQWHDQGSSQSAPGRWMPLVECASMAG